MFKIRLGLYLDNTVDMAVIRSPMVIILNKISHTLVGIESKYGKSRWGPDLAITVAMEVIRSPL